MRSLHGLDLYSYRWQYCPDTGRSTGIYTIFYQGGPIDHWTHFPGNFSQSGAESEYNAACTVETDSAHFRMLIHESLNKDLDIVPEEYLLIILDIKYAVCMANNGKDTKHKRHISRRVHFVRNGDICKIHKIDWC